MNKSAYIHRVDLVLKSWLSNQSRRRKTEFNPTLLRLKFDFVSYLICSTKCWKNTYCTCNQVYNNIYKCKLDL